MATVINNPAATTESTGSGAGIILGVLIAIIAIAALVIYAVPSIRGGARSTTSGSNGATVNVPDKVDVNINKTQ